MRSLRLPAPLPRSHHHHHHHVSFLSRTLSTRHFSSFPSPSSSSSTSERDEGFVSILRSILHSNSKQTWRSSLSSPFVSARLAPSHVEALLLETLDDPRLAHRFFNHLALSHRFPHSPLSFAILAHAFLRLGPNWLAASLLQTLISTRSRPPKRSMP
uniref:Pentatricopeptide repeat-containing protein n=1 Tax=Ananas comosus var. bracteatus TaxID=296719 RepID=A0A6V7PCY8_ANACO|nr:unnamed protein product [Ananas comosus var. bracteatus]